MSIDELRRVGVVAVVRAPSADHAVKAARALVTGGITGIEITYSTPGASEAIERIAEEHGNGVLLGAGTLLSEGQVKEAVAAGARYLVAPGVSPAVVEAMLRSGRTTLVGALTPTEIMGAVALGADAVKVFPASLGGPAYLRSLRGPFPEPLFIPTGGVNSRNLGQWFAAGAFAVGAGSELCSMAAMVAERWDEIESNARDFARARRNAAAAA
jgi:2-dehydro-3-deoxyphosphogluconate aldolase / (4S)-4-hydroxy-2-oxoglutarate aldolase